MKTFKDYLIDPEGVIEEARGLPPKMDYQFDEIDPDVDKNSFRDANKSRRNREADRRQREREDEDHRGFAYNTADGRDPRYHLTNSELAADREWEAEERFARGEEEEQKMPAYRERRKKVTPAYGNGTDYLSRASAKRRDQATNRTMRNSAGYDSVDDLVRNSEEEEQKMSAQRDSTPMLSRAMQNTANVYKKPNLDDKGMKHAAKRSGQSLGRVRRSVNGLRQEEEEQKSPGIRDKMTGFSSQLGQHMRIKNEKRARQNLDRFARRQTGSNHPRNSREEEEESRRSVPRGINYDFDDRKPQRWANRHKSLPAGKSARSNRVVNNSLYRPKTKDEFVKDKAHSAFKESLLYSAIRMLRENYPDDIRSYDHDPRSPFYDSRAEDDESQWLYDLFNGNNPSDMQLYLEENSYDIINKLWDALIDTGSGSDIKVDKDKDAKFSEWLDELMLQYYDPEL